MLYSSSSVSVVWIDSHFGTTSNLLLVEKTRNMQPVQSTNEAIPLIRPILQKHGVNSAKIVGSFARNKHRDDSDVDILVTFLPQVRSSMNVMDVIELQIDLEDVLHRSVDIVVDDLLTVEAIRASMLHDAVEVHL